jgi:tripartite ATP-independent transporter DctM subunit
MESVIALVVLFTFIFVGVPIAYSLGAAALIYVAQIPSIPNQVMIQRFVRGADSFELIAIPMFILAGSILNATGATRRLVTFASALVGSIRGGLAQANIIASMLFAGMSGSANADVAGIGRVLIKAMIDDGYDPDFAAAVTASSACVGPIIPPSTTFIVFGAIALVPIGDLLIAGALPGLLMGFLMMIPTWYLAKKRNYPRYAKFSTANLWKATKESWLILLAPVIIVGGVLTGIFTATEAGVVGAFYATIVGVFIYKEIRLRDFVDVLKDAVYSMSMVMFLLATGLAFSWVLSAERVPNMLVEVVGGMSNDPTLLLLLIGFMMLLLGMFFSVTTNLIMTVPILMPLVNAVGISGVQFGVVCVLGLTIGCVTPPVGAPMYLASQFAGISIGEFFRANKYYYVALVAAFIMVILFPQISLFLPSLWAG